MCSLGRAHQLLDWTGLQNSLLQQNPHNLLLRLHFHVRSHPNSGRTGRPQSSPDRDYLHHQLLRGRHHPHPGRPLLEESPGGVLRVLLLDLLCVLFSFSHITRHLFTGLIFVTHVQTHTKSVGCHWWCCRSKSWDDFYTLPPDPTSLHSARAISTQSSVNTTTSSLLEIQMSRPPLDVSML